MADSRFTGLRAFAEASIRNPALTKARVLFLSVSAVPIGSRLPA